MLVALKLSCVLFSPLIVESLKESSTNLGKSGIDDGWAFTLGYIPQISENIQTVLGVWVKKVAAEDENVSNAEIDNAMDACDRDNPWVEVTVSQGDDELLIRVADSGAGMNAETFARSM